MKKANLMLCGLMILTSLAITLALYPQLPGQMPVHWGADGAVDGYGPRWSVFLMGPGLMALMVLLFAALPKLSPKRFEVESFEDVYGYVAVLVTAATGYFQAVAIWAALSPQLDMRNAVLGGIALLIGLIGNVMGKVRRNYWLGIRTPWTLSSDRVWYATHRLAGKLMVGSALACALGMVVGAPMLVGVALLALGALIPAAYSLVYYKRLEKAGDLHA
ncbi:MAG: SdpI family protein [Pseudomonadota bacterium]